MTWLFGAWKLVSGAASTAATAGLQAGRYALANMPRWLWIALAGAMAVFLVDRIGSEHAKRAGKAARHEAELEDAADDALQTAAVAEARRQTSEERTDDFKARDAAVRDVPHVQPLERLHDEDPELARLLDPDGVGRRGR
jgi:ABC-type multidrug transport system fused ATPase/permease subunit